MPQGQSYTEQLGELRRHIGEPVRGIILLQFAAIPQLDSVVAGFRALDPSRPCLEVLYDPAKENAVRYLDRIQRELTALPADPLPLLILRPGQLPDASTENATAIEFWRALNFRRETLGALSAQILLCVDPWHHDRLLDYAADLRSWTAPKFRLLHPLSADINPPEALASWAKIEISSEAAERRWQTFWPELEKTRLDQRLEVGHVRRYILPLLEASLAQGNLLRARQVRDAAQGLIIPEEDLIEWDRFNVMLACASQDFPSAEDHIRKLLNFAHHHPIPSLQRRALNAVARSIILLESLGQSMQAEDLIRELIQLSSALNGPDHPDTLSGRNSLAVFLRKRGKNEDAEKEHREVLALRERVLGAESPETLTSRTNLAATLTAQGKFKEAEQMLRELIPTFTRVQGPDHLNTLTARNILAVTLLNQDRIAEAEKEQREILAIRERVNGPEHLETLRTRNNLATLLHEQGRHSEAEQEHRTISKLRETVPWGRAPRHPSEPEQSGG